MINSFHTASHQYDSNYSLKNYRSDFDNSIIYGDEKRFDKLYNNYNHENKRLRYNWTPIMLSIWNQNTVFFNHLIKNYTIDMSLKTDNGHTVLHLVCMRKVIEYIEPLILNGSNIYTKDSYGYTPLDYLYGYPVDITKYIQLYTNEQKLIKRK